jgi:GTP-binding protein HflX
VRNVLSGRWSLGNQLEQTTLGEGKRTDIEVASKRCLLVGVHVYGRERHEETPLEELRGLADTAGVEIVGTLLQNRHYLDKKTFLGKGKVEELKALLEETGADSVVFDSGLTPSQARNLEEILEVVIVDRNELILTIFNTHAKSHEARLQVELAQLLYQRPRLKRMWTHLERTEGAVGSRGPGEQQLETDRRLIDQRIDELRERLREVEKRRGLLVKQRDQHPTVSLVGYTNAGKSTLMNALTGADVYVANQLFATLDTRTRTWGIPQFGDVLLSDTVGFIRDLPHILVTSFRSTLEEARHANVLLHVVDASHPNAAQQIKTVNDVLTEIGIDGSAAILVLNKSDAVTDPTELALLRSMGEASVTISAKTGAGIADLTALVMDRLSSGFVEADIESDAGNGKLYAYLAQHAELTGQDYAENRVTYHCRIPRRYLATLPSRDTTVHIRSGATRASGLATISSELAVEPEETDEPTEVNASE